MFKDYDKYLTTSLKVYLFVLVVIFIMKMVGLDYFGLDVNNINILKLNKFLYSTKLVYVIDFISLYLMLYIYIAIVCKDKNVKIVALIFTTIEVIIQFVLVKIDMVNELKSIIDILIMFIAPMIYKRKIIIKKSIIMIFLITLYQAISVIIRGQAYTSNFTCKIIDLLLNLDQMLLLIITFKLYFMKGDVKICHQEVGLSLQKKINLKKSLKKLQKNLHNSIKQFKEQDKVTKISNIIYFILSLIWNTLSVILILIVAKLNDTLIECIFILTSFWLSKGKFGKPFHLKSMTHCFIVSNLTYYVLNRITTPLGISIIIPIMLGVGLSYVTSKLVKKTYKPLYRGMPEDLFEETILKVTDKDSDKYAICYDFYINKKSTVALAMKYNYSEAGIRKIKDRINNKIKEL